MNRTPEATHFLILCGLLCWNSLAWGGVPADLPPEPPQMLFAPEPSAARDDTGAIGTDSTSVEFIEAESNGATILQFITGGFDHHQGEHEAALRHYRHVQDVAPSSVVDLAIGWTFLESGQADSALVYAERASVDLPDQLDPWLLLSRCHLKMGNPGGAETSLRGALEVEPEDQWSFVNLLSLLQRSGQLEAALAMIEPAIPENLASAHLYVRRASLRMKVGRTQGALEDFAEGLKKDPHYPDLEKQVLLTIGKVDRTVATDILDQLLKAQPGLRRIRQARIGMLATGGDWTKALPLLEAEIDDAPDDPRARFQTGLILMRADRPAEAEGHLLMAAALDPENPDPYRWLWRVAESRRDWPQAAAWSDSILTRVPEDPEGFWFRGVSLFELQRLPESTASLRSLLQEKPDHRRGCLLLSAILTQTNQLEPASATLERYLERAPEDEEALFRLGVVQEQSGNVDSALQTLERLIALNPDHHPALNYWGYILIEKGENLDVAMSRIQRALELDPGNPAYLDSYGWGYFQLGRPVEAVRHLELALVDDRSNWLMLKHLGLSLERSGQASKAGAVFQEALALEPSDVELLDAMKRVTDTN